MPKYAPRNLRGQRLLLFLSLALTAGLTALPQSTFNLPAPPVTLEYSVSGAPKAGDQAAITITVTPQEDMHLDINCLLPRGVAPVIEPGVQIVPYREKFTPNLERQKNYRLGANIFTGPLKAGETKAFTFHVVISSSGTYNFVCLADALKTWGQKELDFSVDVN